MTDECNRSLPRIKRVMFELSNRCNYAHAHKQCPLHARQEEFTETLPGQVVNDVLAWLAAMGWSGRISFHNYNDPLLDPRLYAFIVNARKTIPASDIFILTNGWMLDQNLLNDLGRAGVSSMEVSSYSDREHFRLVGLRQPDGMRYAVKRHNKLDERLDIYTHDCSAKRTRPYCNSPLAEIVIRCNGDVALCCFDHAGSHTYGNVKRESLQAVLDRGIMLNHSLANAKGDFVHRICKNCWVTRE